MAGKTVPFRIYAQILIFCGLVASGVLILLPIMRVVQVGMISIRDDLITCLEERIDRKIKYSSISPSIFGSFDVRGVSIVDSNDHPVLTMTRFRVAYSLFDLLRGRLHAIHSIQIDSPLIDFNTAQDSDLIALFENLSDGPDMQEIPREGFSAFFPEKLLIRIRNGRCLVIDNMDRYQLYAHSIIVEIADSQVSLDGSWDFSITRYSRASAPVSLNVAMKAIGSFRSDMSEGEAFLSIPFITGDVMGAHPIAFSLGLEGGVLRLEKTPDPIPVDFFLEYALDDKAAVARFDCTDFRLRDFFSFSGGLEGVRQFLDIGATGGASFERKDDGSLGYSIDMAGVALAPLVSGVSTLPAQFAQSSFRINAAGDDRQIRVYTLRFSMPRSGGADAYFFGDVGFNGSIGLEPFAPYGTLSLNRFSFSGAESLDATISLHTDEENGVVTILSDRLSAGAVGLADLRAVLRPAEGGMGFSVSARQPPASWGGSPGSLSLQGSFDSESRDVNAGLRLVSFPSGDLAGMAQPFVKGGAFLVPLRAFLGAAPVDTDISFAVSGRDRRFELGESRITSGGETLAVSGSAGYSGPSELRFAISAAYRDLAYAIEGLLNDGAVSVQGSYGLYANFEKSGGGYTGFARAEVFPLPFLGHPALLSFQAELNYASPSRWNLNLEEFELANLNAPAGPAVVRVFGSAGQAGASLPLLYYRDSAGPLSGKAEIAWPGNFSSFAGSADMGEGAEAYHAEGRFADGRLSLGLSGSSMRADRVLGGRVSALADGDIQVQWSAADSFRVELSLFSVAGKIYHQDFGASGHAVLDSKTLAVNDVFFRLSNFDAELSRLVVVNHLGLAESRAEVSGDIGGRPVKGGLTLSANFNPIKSWLEAEKALNSFSGTAFVEGFSYGGGQGTGGEEDFTINFSRSNGALSVLGGPRGMIRFRMEDDGSFYAGLSSPFPVRGTAIGTIHQNVINARCPDLYVDVGELFDVLPEIKGLYLTGGYLNAALDIRGPLADPEFFGSARGTSLRVKVPDFVAQELRPIPFNIAIKGNEMRFGPVSTAVGNGAAEVSGWFLFDRWIPNVFSLDVAIPREAPVPYGFDIDGFIAHGDVYGSLVVSMEDATLDVSGDLYVNNTELGINSDEVNRPQVAPGPDEIPVVVDLTVSTGPVVDFYYPSSRIPILRASPDIGTKIRVTADSFAQQYTLTGDVRIRGGEIYYFERSFFIRSGTLRFRENEQSFDPRITARAEVRDRTDEGPVTISMIVDNAPLLSFTARFESNPPLSQVDIFALLGQNITGANADPADTISRVVGGGSEILMNWLLGRQLEQQLRSFMRLDMFSIRTQVIQNAISMAPGLNGQSDAERPSSIGNYFDNTTVFGGKYIGQDMFVQGMLTMRYDANNTTIGGMTFAPDIGIELKNPLFSIRWDFMPTHPENWYVNDNSITLTKNWTF